MYIIRIISVCIIILSILLIFITNILSRKNNNKPQKKKDKHNFCILIPARDESRVIGSLLESIKNQTHKINMKDVYVIVESEEDKTVNICAKYNASVIYRKNLKLQRKGYALNDAVEEILSKNKHYDAYFVFDADNILDKNFIKNMIPIYDLGYDLASGYRNCKNGNASVVAASSALTFSLVNTIFNNNKNKYTKNITFSGTGFYIRGNIIEKLKSYPFHTLTEDYEISIYATINNLTTYYNKESIFYDEQPVKYKDTINQRERWIRGYFDVRWMFRKELTKKINQDDKNYGSKLDTKVGVYPFAFMIISMFIYLFGLVSNYFITKNIIYIYELLIFAILLYNVLLIFTLILIILEGNNINLSKKIKIKTLFYNPIFIISFIPCAIRALTKREVKWKKVEHGK